MRHDPTIRHQRAEPVPADDVPDQSWTKDEIREYLDSVGTEHYSSDTKSELLDRV